MEKKCLKENLIENTPTNSDNNNIITNALVIYKNNDYLDFLYNKDLKSHNKNHFLKALTNIVEFVFDKVTKWFVIIGPLFINAFICFFIIGYHSFLNNLIPYWSSNFYYSYECKIFYYLFLVVVCPLYTIFYFQLVLYYVLTVIVKPGSVEDLKKSTKFKKRINPYYCYNQIPNLNYILRMNNFNYKNKKIFPYCKYCKEIKPLRTHHCSLCQKCHLRMDHHCPLVNNCIGLCNFRYFILFLFYLWVVCIFNTILSVYPFFSLKRFDNNNELSFISIVAMCGIVISTFFNIWYWSMVRFNKTSIEFWSGKLRLTNWVVKSYCMKTFKENLYFTFCSKNLFQILFIPNLKSLDISGLEWSKIADPSFEIKGIKNNLDLI